MDLNKYYNKLPNFIKYNKNILNFSIKLAKKFHKFDSRNIDSNHELFNILLVNCEIKPKGTLKNIQLLYIEFLRFFDNICNKYDIEYWLDWGSLLGAVRHEGFILWDDDIDVSMMRRDYEKFINIIPKEIKKYDFLKDNCGLTLPINNNENYFKEFKDYRCIKDCDEYPLKDRFLFFEFSILKPYIKIDIFPKDFILSNKIDYFKDNYLSAKYQFYHNVTEKDYDFNNEFKNRCDELGLVKNKKEYYVNSLDTIIVNPPLVFKTNNTFPLKKIKFEGYEFSCPRNPDFHLKKEYGNDYMKIPKVIQNHNMVNFIEKQFSSKNELNQTFNYFISYLKEINDNDFL